MWYNIITKGEELPIRKDEKTMKKWYIFGIEGQCSSDIIVIAESFDEALKAAREIDSNYIGGYIIENNV